MPSFNSMLGKNVADTELPVEYSTPQKRTNLLSKVFGIMFIALFVTAGLSYVVSYLIKLFSSGNSELMGYIYVITLFVSAFGLLVMAFVLPKTLYQKKHAVIPNFALLIFFMSLLLSTLYLIFDLLIILITFAASALIFGIMSLLGLMFKGNIKGVVFVINALIIGALVISLINIFIGSTMLDWAVSFGIFAFELFITMLNVRDIKQIVYAGSQNSYNVVIFGAFILYLDFIEIFIRVLPYVAEILSKKD